MKIKIPHILLLIILGFCGCSDSKMNRNKVFEHKILVDENEKLELFGDYLIMNESFFNDTLYLKAFSPSDSTIEEKTLITFSEDSVYLKRWNPDPWDGKGMLGYNTCSFEQLNDSLSLKFTFTNRSINTCDSVIVKSSYSVRKSTKYDFQLILSSKTSFGFPQGCKNQFRY